MSSANSHVYRKISAASRALQKATKITFRRKAAEDLVKLLTDTNLRTKLKKEFTLKNTSSTAKNNEIERLVRKELAEFYRGIFRDALDSTLQTLKSKVKFKLEDVILILKVLRAIDAESDNAISSQKEARNHDWCYVTEPFTFESFDRYRGSNSTNTYLSGNEIKSTLKNCLAWLQSEEICSVAENDLINLLFKLCSRADYVSSFGTSNILVSDVMEELHERIITNCDDKSQSHLGLSQRNNRKTVLALNAAKTFYNLIHHLIAVLGIEITIFVVPCLKLVVEWIRDENSDPILLQFMYGVVVEIFAAYPQLCVGIFKEGDDKNLGKDIFGYAVRAWNTSRNIDRDVLVGYFSAHLLVCEHAGNMQGLLPGDLGDVGSASLNESKILQLAEMFLANKSLEVFSDLSIQKNIGNESRGRSRERNHGRNKKRRATGQVYVLQPLSKKERRYLEFCARILRCAQRYSLMGAERKESGGDVLKTIVDDCVVSNSDGLKSLRSVASIENLSKCPWNMFVMKGLCSQINVSHETIRSKLSLGDTSKTRSRSKQNLTIAQSEKVGNVARFSFTVNEFPMKAGLHKCLQKYIHEQVVSNDQVKICLQIISACAEVFPRGECWSSTNKWYQSNFSPLDGDPDYLLEERHRSYCSACSLIDLAGLVNSVCDILCHHGTTGGDLNIQMWALLCLLKLTESSKIAARYWDKSNFTDERDHLPTAWQRVWDSIFRQDLRFVSYTANAFAGSHGEVVLMLLTEITRWSLTKSEDEFNLKREHGTSFLQKRQDNIWKLPVFKSAKRVQSSAIFELISMLLIEEGLVEGGEDSINENDFDEVLRYVPSSKRPEGGQQRYRITLFCLSFVISAIKRDDFELLRRLLPFVTDCVATLSGNGNISLCTTSFSILNNRFLRVTESRYCVNENEKIKEKKSNFSAAWKDSVEPFWFQFTAESNNVLWDQLNGRDSMLCLPWSMEDRNWLNQTSACKDGNYDHITSSLDAIQLHNVGISAVLCALGFGTQTNNTKYASGIPIISHLLAAKFVIILSLSNKNNLKDCSIQWRFIEEMFDYILENVIEYMDKTSNNSEVILSEIVGIFRLLRRVHLHGKCHHQIRGLLSSSKLQDFYNVCRKQLESPKGGGQEEPRNGKGRHNVGKSYAASEESGIDSENESNEEESIPCQFNDVYPDTSQSEQESDDFDDSDENSERIQSGMKRKSTHSLQNNKNSKRKRENSISNSNRDIKPETEPIVAEAKISWLCAYILSVLNPCFEVVDIIEQSSILPQDSVEPHNFVLSLGLFCNFIPLSLTDPAEKGDYTVYSMCRDLIKEGRTAAEQYSPYSYIGFQACKRLTNARMKEETSLSSQEIEDLMQILIPEENSSKILRSMKTRPILKFLQVNAGMICFRDGGTEFRERFHPLFMKAFVAESLRAKSSKLRRMGSLAMKIALAYFKFDQEKIVIRDNLRLLPPFEVNFAKKIGRTLDDWVEKKVASCSNKQMVSSERTFWEASLQVLHSDLFYIIGVIMGSTSDEDLVLEVLRSLFWIQSGENDVEFLKLKLFESIAFLRNYKCLEDQFQEYKFNFICHWIENNNALLSVPTIICPSPIRYLLRMGYSADLNHIQLQKFVADEFVNQNVSIIVPYIFIDQPRREFDDEVKKKRDRLLSEVVEVCSEDSLSNLLRSHIHDIYAFLIPIMHCKVEDKYLFWKRGTETMSFLQSFPKIGHRHVARTSHLIVAQMIQLCDKRLPFENNIPISRVSVVAAVKFFTEKVMNIKINPTQGILENAGSSTIECLLHVRHLLDTSSYPNGKQQALKMIDLIIEEVKDNVCAKSVQNPQLGFSMCTLLNLLIDNKEDYHRCEIVLKLKMLMDAVTRDKDVVDVVSDDLTWILNKLVMTMIKIHEECQNRIIRFCLETYQRESLKITNHLTFKHMSGDLSLSTSLLSAIDEVSTTDLLGIAISRYGYNIPPDLLHLVESTYEILNLILLEKRETLQEFYTSIDPFPNSSINEEDERNLRSFNSCFSLSDLLDSAGNMPQTVSSADQIYNEAKRFERVAKRFLGKSNEHSSDGLQNNLYGLDARTLMAGIENVKKALTTRKNGEKTSSQFSDIIVRTLAKTVKHLFDFCSDKFSLDLQVAASSCLGSLLPILQDVNVDTLEVYNTQPEKRTFFKSKDEMYDHFFEDILKHLVEYVKSEKIETAITAKDTLKAIFMTHDGSSFWNDLKPGDDIKKFASPLEIKEKAKLDVDKVPVNFFHEILQNNDLNEVDLAQDSSWCWTPEIWRCDIESEVKFEDWIRVVVCAMLLCCYNKDSSGNSTVKSLIHGSSDFFRPCLKLCTKEYKFAQALFPAIIFDVLSSDTKDSSKIGSTKSYFIGAASSLSNQTITHCFEIVLKPSESRDEVKDLSQDSFMSKSNESSSNLDAVKTVVDVLNTLRCITEHGFYCQKHNLNVLSIQGRKYDAKKGVVRIEDPKDSYNNLKLSTFFSGRPYGIVLDFHDTEIARSYLQLKDYTAAIYYAEHFADNRLGGSSCSFEMYRSRCIKQTSLSGFGIEVESIECKETYLRAVEYHDILKKCYTALHEDDNLKGLEEQTSMLRFERPECFKDENRNFSSFGIENRRVLNDKSLMVADALSQIDSGRGILNPRNQASVLSSLSNLGLRDTARHYIAGLSVSKEIMAFSKIECGYVMEKWAEETWRMLQWDDTLFPKNPSANVFECVYKPLKHDKDLVRKAFRNYGNQNLKIGFNDALSNLFQSITSEDLTHFSSDLYHSRAILLEDFNKDVGTKPSNGLYSHSLKFMIMSELEDLGEVISGSLLPSEFLAKWCSKVSNFEGGNKTFSFKEIESAMACREISLKLIFRKFGKDINDEIGSNYFQHLQRTCVLAQKHARPNLATSALERMRRFLDLTCDVEEDCLKSKIRRLSMNLEEARILHSGGDATAAVRTCKLIISSINQISMEQSEQLSFLKGETLLQCGTWLIKHKIDSATIVLNQYIRRAAEQAQSIHENHHSVRSTKLLSSTHFVLAEFVANLYDSVEKRVNSQEWKTMGNYAEARKKELEDVTKLIKNFRKSPHKSKKSAEFNLKIEQSKLKKEVEMDTRERNAVEASVSSYLRLAIRAYGVALSHCTGLSVHSKHVFRLVSLWFRNSNGEGKGGDINALIASDVTCRIPSYHFVPLIYQIFSRIDSSIDMDQDDYTSTEAYHEEFQNVLIKLIARICMDHPYHGLVQLIALSNGHNVAGRQASAYLDNVGHSKVEASAKLLASMEKDDPDFLAYLIQSYKTVIDAYISLAVAPTKPFAEKRITKNIAIRDLIKGNKSQTGNPLDSCLRRSSQYKPCVLTKTPTIRAGSDYGDGLTSPVGSEFIDSFQSTCSITDTGIHRPKIVICNGSNGGRFKQLVKGEDDIRQDAIMQQVFQTVNILFQNQSTSQKQSSMKSNIKLHTYSCIPLSPSNGVLEWVDNTTSFGDFLYRSSDGKKMGAHEKYYPGEWDINLCRSHYMCSPRDEIRASYDEICKNFSPCFRFFFLERFSHSPQRWHDARMAYVRSSAVNSIVGHILGIGDRHSHNILIHEKTGEVVHIDFGIVFEQGKLLSTPETVPFRLTRDVVDGFGPNGTDGAFTATAEATAEILRENANALITVLSAVVSDPLYSWSVSPVKARQREDESIFSKESQVSGNNTSMPALAMIAENENDAATLTIAKINEKLQGYEEGTYGEQQTVEGQVRLLINAARDPDNLCTLYHGWMSWL